MENTEYVIFNKPYVMNATASSTNFSKAAEHHAGDEIASCLALGQRLGGGGIDSGLTVRQLATEKTR
jgi:hypothetical protein